MHNTGQCHCGQITFKVEGEPLRMAQCHCAACRRMSGTGHASNAFFKNSQVTVSGETSVYSYTADSGNVRNRHFCPNCGSRLFTMGPSTPDIIGIHMGAFDEYDWFKPQSVLFTDQAPDWDKTDPEIPHFDTMPK